jgi:hypothetical protein
VLATAILIPIGVLAWLGAKILLQESDVERQLARETLEVSTERLALAIDRRFGEIELQIGRGGGLHLTPNGIEGPQIFPCSTSRRNLSLWPLRILRTCSLSPRLKSSKMQI